MASTYAECIFVNDTFIEPSWNYLFPARILIDTHPFQEVLANNSHSLSDDGIFLYHTVLAFKYAHKFFGIPLFKEWSLSPLSWRLRKVTEVLSHDFLF